MCVLEADNRPSFVQLSLQLVVNDDNECNLLELDGGLGR